MHLLNFTPLTSAAALLLISAAWTNASVIVEVSDVPAGLLVTATGSIDTTGLGQTQPLDSIPVPAQPDQITHDLISLGKSSPFVSLRIGGTNPQGFFFFEQILGTELTVPQTQNTGDFFVVTAAALVAFEIDQTFSVGDLIAIQSETVFVGSSLNQVFGDSLDSGPFVIAVLENGEEVTLQAASVVPEPTSLTVLFIGGALGAWAFKARRRV